MEATRPSSLKGYELRERIGAGGFGAVYRAYQSTVGREVAVKIILPGLANQPEFIRRFEAEAQIVARLEHPHIVPLHDYWRDPEGAYLIMRWLRGGNLHDALQKSAYDVPAAALLLDQIAGALSLAHRNHVIHRDIKPANILLDEDGNAYLTDFGIAKDLNLAVNNTQPDAIVGSLDYISPEQARSEAVTHRTDIYSLGVTFYEVLTGEHPFQNLSSVERLYKHINDPLPDITSLDPILSAPVNRVIQKATAKNPEHRYADVLDFAADFRQAIAVQATPINMVELLTQREQEILQLIVDGKSNKEIAQELTVTLSTVKWYVNQIYTKLGVRSRVQAMVRARELNLLTKSVKVTSLPPVPTEDFQPENPYKGLHAFQSADNLDFFGRENVTAKLVKQLEEGQEFKRFLAVVGPSGSGKSSIVKAGLIPALWRGELPGSEKWFIVEMLPGAHPLDELEVALTRVAANQSGGLQEQLSRDKRGLIRAAQLILPADGSELVLVIDQFEEVFTLLEDESARTHFLDLLYTVVTEPRSRVRVIITLRADFYDRPLHYPDFGELVRSRMETLLPLSAQELERAISKPAERVGVFFEPGLVASIVAEVNYQAGALPLLQYALTELFEQRRGRLLTREAYDALGGSVGALARRADEIYTDFSSTNQEAARQMFLRLVTLGEGVEDTRRRVNRSELLALGSESDVMDEVIDTYAEYRLLSLDNDPATRTPTVELAHEAILRAWVRLHNWLNENRDDIKSQRQLAAMAAEWRTANQDTSFLARGARLEQFEKWIADTQLALTQAERNYLSASIAQRTVEDKAEEERKAREKLLEKRSVRFLRALVTVLIIALIGAAGLIGLAINQSQVAQRNAAETQNIALISGSETALVKGNADEAIALALEAVTLNPRSGRAQTALSEAAYAPGTIRRFIGHTEIVKSVALSSDGNTALSASWDQTVILWNIHTGEIIHRLTGHTGKANAVVFMPDGLSAISGSSDKSLILWNLQTGDIIRRFEGQSDEIWAVAISPDGRYAASGDSQGNLLLWHVQTGEVLRRFEGHTDKIEGLDFSADGTQLLSASDDLMVMLWDVETGQTLHRFEGHAQNVYRAVFSPDGHTILSASDDGMNLWDITTGQIIHHFYENGVGMYDAVFSPDGRLILSAGQGGLVLWNIETQQPIRHFLGQGLLHSVVFSLDGRTALSGSEDTTLRLWDLESGQVIRRFDVKGTITTGLEFSPDGRLALAGWHSAPRTDFILYDVNTGAEIHRYSINETTLNINIIAFSPDGHTALLGTDQGNKPSDLILWNVDTGVEIRRFVGHPAGIVAVAFSPDGYTAVSAGWNGVMILWDIATGMEIRRFKDYPSADPNSADNGIYVGFSPDGQTLVTTDRTPIIVLWNVTTGEVIRHFEGHSANVFDFVFSADGKQAFSGSADGTAILWDTATGTILNRFIDHSGPVARVDMTTNGTLGIGASVDGTTILWNLKTGEMIRRYNANPFIALFSPDNHTVLISENPQHVELWRVDATVEELVAWTRANRYVPQLTCSERALYRLEPRCDADTTPVT